MDHLNFYEEVFNFIKMFLGFENLSLRLTTLKVIMMAKILIVDDDLLQLEQMEKWLAPLGHELRLLLQPEFLFQRVEKEAYHLILMDVEMPKMDGISLLKQLKNHPLYRDIPVMMLISNAEDPLITKCLKWGATDYVSKPINPTLFKKRIKNTLQRQNDSTLSV